MFFRPRSDQLVQNVYTSPLCKLETTWKYDNNEIVSQSSALIDCETFPNLAKKCKKISLCSEKKVPHKKQGENKCQSSYVDHSTQDWNAPTPMLPARKKRTMDTIMTKMIMLMISIMPRL